ncbi:MAG: response regulator [Myxococcota bacterium]
MLLVEDDDADAALITRYLKRAPVHGDHRKVVRVSSLEEAVDHIEANSPMAVLLDLGLPDTDGLDGLTSIATAYPDLPIVVLTGLDDDDMGIAALHQGAQDFLTKSDLNGRSLWRAVGFAVQRKQTDALQRRLYHANRLASIGQLAAGVAHEVNNPAAFITANLSAERELLEDLEGVLSRLRVTLGAEFGPAVRERVDAIFAQGNVLGALREATTIGLENAEGIERIRSIVADLKAFSRIDEASIRWVDMNDVVDAACTITRNEVRHRAELIIDAKPVPLVAGDHARLCQVLINLLVNAAQAITKGTTEQNYVRVATRSDGDYISVEVADSGSGVAPENQDRLFQPFFTTKARDDGSGLGLALCAETVRKHHGQITFTSALGEGTSFVVRIPVDTGLRPSLVPRSPTQQPSDRKARVLLVDDEASIRRAFTRIIGREHTVVDAANGEEALALLLGDETPFDLILCDLMMPGVDGVELYQRLLEHDAALAQRIVFMSGGVFTERANRFLTETSAMVLEKPIAKERLLGIVRRAVSDTGSIQSEG